VIGHCRLEKIFGRFISKMCRLAVFRFNSIDCLSNNCHYLFVITFFLVIINFDFLNMLFFNVVVGSELQSMRDAINIFDKKKFSALEIN